MRIRQKREAEYKQMAFETAVRNPERYRKMLLRLSKFEGTMLNDANLLEIIAHLYVVGEVSSSHIRITNSITAEEIKESVIEVNSTRNADGGFPKGYASRFWTYMRTLSELGFVYAQYRKPFKLSRMAKILIKGEVDEQEAFSVQAMKYNRKSPYRNVSNDFNFFRFALNVLLSLREEGKSLSYEQFVPLLFSKNGNVAEFLTLLSKNKFNNPSQAYRFVEKEYGVTNKIATVTDDYPDVVRRLMLISGFISIRYAGKKLIQINESKLDYIKELLNIDFALTDEEKADPKRYFEKLDKGDALFWGIVEKYRKYDKIDGAEYTNKISAIISSYRITERIICESLDSIGSTKSPIAEFGEIPDPLKLEFYISILIAIKYGDEFYIRPNYKADHVGKPYAHAPGGRGDIDVYSSEVYWLIEVTLIRNRDQMLNTETTSVIRHLHSSAEFKNRSKKYLSLVAPMVHPDIREFFEYSLVKHQREGGRIHIKAYSLKEFVAMTLRKENFKDMEVHTRKILASFGSRSSKV